MNLFKRSIQAHNPVVTFTPNPQATLERRIERVKRLQRSLDKAVRRGDVRKAARLQEELNFMSVGLLEEKENIEAILRAREEVRDEPAPQSE